MYSTKTKTDGSQLEKGATNGAAEFDTTTLLITLANKTSSLAKIFSVLEEQNVCVQHVESRAALGQAGACDILIEVSVTPSKLQEVVGLMTKSTGNVIKILPNTRQDNFSTKKLQGEAEARYVVAKTAREQLGEFPDVPWFATTLSELVTHQGKTLQCGDDLQADHPSFSDAQYRARRKVFTDISNTYVLGQPIPRVEYSEEETRTWGTVFRTLTNLYPSHACETYNENFKLLVQQCGFGQDEIPQMEDVSNFLHTRTGFRLRPISGLVEFRDYLAGLAFRVFQATQYIRHHSSPEYTPEPDVCHEFLGHIPLFCDPEFAQFSQELGLASLGAPDEWIEKLGSLYWYTVEFGLCREKNGSSTRAYGGALLSSFGELQRCLSDGTTRLPLETETVAATPYCITQFQEVYFVAESFQDVREKLACWITQIPRPFSLRYNAHIDGVELLYKKEHLSGLVREIQTDMKILKDAINKLK